MSAIEALEKSIELGAGGGPIDWFFLAMAHGKLGHTDQARKFYTQAVDWIQKKKSQNDELLRFRAEAAALLGVTDPSQVNRHEGGKPDATIEAVNAGLIAEPAP